MNLSGKTLRTLMTALCAGLALLAGCAPAARPAPVSAGLDRFGEGPGIEGSSIGEGAVIGSPGAICSVSGCAGGGVGEGAVVSSPGGACSFSDAQAIDAPSKTKRVISVTASGRPIRRRAGESSFSRLPDWPDLLQGFTLCTCAGPAMKDIESRKRGCRAIDCWGRAGSVQCWT